MTPKRAAVWACLVLAVPVAPVAGLAGMAAWQELAPASLRQVILTAAAMTEPQRVDSMLEDIGVATPDKAATPG